MKALVILLSVVAAAAAHGHKVCLDSSTATCACADGTVIVQKGYRGDWGSRGGWGGHGG